MITNTNFPAALSVLAFLGTIASGIALLLIAAYGSATSRKWKAYPITALVVLLGAYGLTLAGFSYVSRDRLLRQGEEKYFCEIDCHLAYSIAGVPAVQTKSDATALREVTLFLKTRFDENSISARRPKDAPLTPNPRAVVLLDSAGRRYSPSFPAARSAQERPLTEPLIPGASYLTAITFTVPADAHDLRLLITSGAGPERVMIGHEESFGHGRAYFRVD